jgi:hypothetical protein
MQSKSVSRMFMIYGLNTTNIVTKTLNQSIKCLRLTKIKDFMLISMLVVTLIPVPLQSAVPSPHPGGRPADTFSILLSGPYKAVPEKPIADCPDLGLLQANICDGSYSTTKIFSVSGLPDEDSGRANRGKRSGDDERDMKRIGTFYVQFVGNHAAYDLPGGALTMLFTANNLVPAPDGQGGTYFVGTVDLDIVEATGIFESFVGGHNKMVDILHMLADGTFVEHCICVISRPQQSAAITPHASQGETGDRRFDRKDATV